MISLTGSQKKYLRGVAHSMKPQVFIGQKWLTEQVIKEIRRALDDHELIKVKCIEFKEKSQKKEIATAIEEKANCCMVGMIGHMLMFFRQQTDPEKRKITLPAPKSSPQPETEPPQR